jgi:hypothetical protein
MWLPMNVRALWQKIVELLSQIALPTTVFTVVFSLPLIVGTSMLTNDMDLVGRMMRNLWALSLLLALFFSIRYVLRSRRLQVRRDSVDKKT